MAQATCLEFQVKADLAGAMVEAPLFSLHEQHGRPGTTEIRRDPPVLDLRDNADAADEAQLFEKKINSEKEVQTARAILLAPDADFVAIREEIAFARQRD